MNKKLEQYLRARLKPQTAMHYIYELENFLKTQPKARWYKYQDIIECLESLKHKDITVNTRSKKLSIIKYYYDYLEVELWSFTGRNINY